LRATDKKEKQQKSNKQNKRTRKSCIEGENYDDALNAIRAEWVVVVVVVEMWWPAN
jgi:hypothetical protein